MSKEEKHFYSAKEIQLYHEGKMTSGQRHAIEKAALEDPFLADAIEGFTYTTTPEADIIELEKRLERKQGKTKVISIYSLNAKWLRIAAFFLLLAGCGWLIYETALNNNNADIAMTQMSDTSKNISLQTTPNLRTGNTQAKGDTSTTSTSAEITQKTTKGNEIINDKNTSSPVQPQPQNRNSIAVKHEAGSITSKPATDSNNTVASAESASDMAALVSAPGLKKVIQGRVVNGAGNPLPFATITYQNNMIATTTDVNGKFSLPVTDTIVNATIAAIGYQQGRMNLNAESNTEQKIVMKESNESLQEVVVTALAQRQNKKAKLNLPVLEESRLKPGVGWVNFNQYVAKNMKRPKEENNVISKGVVSLVFSIDKKGKPINIQIEKTFSPAYDKEAIRLLQEGPVWKGSLNEIGKVEIKF